MTHKPAQAAPGGTPLMFKTFHDLRRRTQNARPGTVAYRAHNLIISAETNANETPDSDFDEIAFGSLECLLAYSDDKAVIRWFARHGITA